LPSEDRQNPDWHIPGITGLDLDRSLVGFHNLFQVAFLEVDVPQIDPGLKHPAAVGNGFVKKRDCLVELALFDKLHTQIVSRGGTFRVLGQYGFLLLNKIFGILRFFHE
jgi:hypothetical protein